MWCWKCTIWGRHSQKIKVQPNVKKVRSYVMLVLLNVTTKSSFARKKKLNLQTWQKYSHMWVWHFMIWKWYHQMLEKRWVQLNVAKVLPYVMLVLLNVIMDPSNVRKKIRELLNVIKIWLHVMLVLSKSQYNDGTVKCD